MTSRFVDEDLDWLVEEDAGSKTKGHFIQDPVTGLMQGSEPGSGTSEGGGAGKTSAEVEGAAPLHPEAVNVGGDEWNKETALRLEKEFAAAAPELEKIVGDAVHGKADVETDPEEPDPDNAPFVPEDWSMLSQSQQDDALEQYKSGTFNEYHDSEVTNWYENNGLDDAADKVAYDFKKGDTAWAVDAINEYKDENRIPFPTDQLINALTIEYDTGWGMISKGLKIDFDDSELTEPEGFDPKQQTLPGIEPVEPSSFLTEDMRKGLIKTLEKAFESEADDVLQKMEPPPYIDESVAEYQEENWSQLEDKEKFAWVEAHTDIVSDAQKEYDDYFGNTKEGGETGKIDKLPNKFDPLQQNASAADYTRTQLIARHLSVERAANLMVARGVKDSNNVKLSITRAREVSKNLDRTLWLGWKGSSHGAQGQLLQVAAHDELGGRLNPAMVNAEESRAYANSVAAFGSYDAVKAYMRAKWETSQYLLAKAGINTVNTFRAVNIPYVEPIRISTQSNGTVFEFSHTFRFDSEAKAFEFTNSEKAAYPESTLSVGKARDGSAIVTATYTFGNRATAEQKVAQIEKSDPAQHREEVSTPQKDEGRGVTSSTVYTRLPDIHIVRNGAASTSVEAKVSNDWDGSGMRVVLRASVPRTAVISVPAYGQNVYGEHEVVVAGTAWKGWDAWYRQAPPFEKIPVGHQIAA